MSEKNNASASAVQTTPSAASASQAGADASAASSICGTANGA
jgi:hypothetical protein